MVAGEGVAAYVRLPVGKSGGAAERLPAFLPVAGDAQRYVAQSLPAAQRHHSAAARFTALGGNDDSPFIQADVMEA